MKKRHIFRIFAGGILSVGIAACSDNFNDALEPSSTPTTLSAQLWNGEPLRKLEFDAGPKDTTIYVVSNTRWAAELDEGGWCSINMVSGSGNQSFRLSVLEDMNKYRDATLTLYKLNAQNEKMEDGKWPISISQESSNVKLSPSDVEPFGAKPISGMDFQITANVAWTLSVNYEKDDVHFINIEPKSGMTDRGDGTYSGNSAASFSITLQNNGTAAVRRATLELKSDAGSYSVDIVQQKSEYTFDVSPNNTRYIDAVADTIDFTVLSLVGWKVDTAETSWISFSESGKNEGSESRVGVKAYIAKNLEGRQRRGVIRFTPDNSGYVPVEVEVVQNGLDLVFSGSFSQVEDPLTEAGGTFFYSLDSRFNWDITSPGWITVQPSSGKGSKDRQTIEMRVGINNSYSSRNDTIRITPLETDFEGDFHITPKDVGVYPIKIFIDQAGGHEAAISRPWIEDEVYEQEKVMVKYNFYSPSYEVKEACLRWKQVGAADWQHSASVTPSDPHSATVSFLLEDLKGATKYEAQGYVVYSNGMTKEGKISYEFTTSGQFPNKGDNNPVTK